MCFFCVELALTYEVAWNNEEDHNIIVEVHDKSQPDVSVSEKKINWNKCKCI